MAIRARARPESGHGLLGSCNKRAWRAVAGGVATKHPQPTLLDLGRHPSGRQRLGRGYGLGIPRSSSEHELIRQRLKAEVGRLDKDAPWRVALVCPSAYSVAMSSLGYQTIYRLLQGLPGIACERFCLPDGGERPGAVVDPPVSYEHLRPLAEFPLIAFSTGYELEIVGVVRLLTAAKVPVLARDRGNHEPLVIFGGALTYANPLPLGPLADAVVLGEAEDTLEPLVEAVRSRQDREQALRRLAELPHVWVPALHGSELPPPGHAAVSRLPAVSAICTPNAELYGMFLVEAERGCSRNCTYCVMRRDRSGGMRLVPAETVLGSIPESARRVGLVGAAVSDHPDLARMLETLAGRGAEVGVSSLRPERLGPELVAALASAGGRTLTTAVDGASEKLRTWLGREVKDHHLIQAAERARAQRFKRLKLYLMLGVPDETDQDIDDGVRLLRELARLLPVALAVSPFCAKSSTPLCRAPYAGLEVLERRLERLRRGLGGVVTLRATSTKWGWVEHVLGSGTQAEGMVAVKAAQKGGAFADFRAGFVELGHSPKSAEA